MEKERRALQQRERELIQEAESAAAAARSVGESAVVEQASRLESESVREGQRAERADRIAKEGVRSVERIDIAIPVTCFAPSHCLHGARNLEGKFIKLSLSLVLDNTAFKYVRKCKALDPRAFSDATWEACLRADETHWKPHIESVPTS